ncbi:hypothetical protein GCM10025857_40110 [Alicyclobacillus contaminans]|uniref:DUF4406 domain-containing protein n=1 Tax=Alicyclobacillus contaminans TaxID=392016 RepID=UPI00040CBC8B|nr:DUF4406 domain-containing protein [Alicyclobacillus contaminans]GMA52595.1 hypothetical protein GCM10025857_39520 [Alicyclobacillus contaminans]GMA52654.1 hypothetical protein GCM10025857_40110 [Alicyclobacillus contaminans]
MKIYISGPMTGLPEYNFPAFNRTASFLRSLGIEVINPAEGVTELDKPWDWYMRRALRLLLDADMVLMLPGWQQSPGARLERDVAQRLGMPVSYLEALTGLFGKYRS